MRRHQSPPGTAPQNAVYRHMIDIAESVADAALRGADAGELTGVLAEATGRRVLLLAPSGATRSSAGGSDDAPGWDPADPDVARVLTALSADRRPLRVLPIRGAAILGAGCVAMPIAVEGTLLGYLVVLGDAADDTDDDVDLPTVSSAGTLFALTLAHELTTTELGQRLKGTVVDTLVSGHFLDTSDARRKAASIGVTDASGYRVAALRADPMRCADRPAAYAAFERCVDAVLAATPGAVGITRGWQAVAIVTEPDSTDPADAVPAQVLLETLGTAVHACCPDVITTAGISEPTASPDQAPQAMREADLAIDLGLRLGRAGQVIAYGRLGIYRLLLQIGDMQQLYDFAVDVLGPLIDYDTNHKVELIRTLSVYLNEHASLKQAARRLRLHTNTISYRVQRIQQLTPLDLDDPDDRLMAHVAVKIVESLRPPADV